MSQILEAGIRPNFVIAGAARSGTTALSRALKNHPEVFFTEPKEVHYFSSAATRPRFTGPGDEVVDRSVVSDTDQFLALFAGATEPLRGEGSVSTLYYADRSIEALREVATPDCKVIVMLREPAERAYSAYLLLRSRQLEDCESFAAALELEAERMAVGWHHLWHYQAMSRYDQQLPQFAAAFGDRLKVVIFEEYRSDPAKHLQEISGFLGLEQSAELMPTAEVNRGGEPRSALLAMVINRTRQSPNIGQVAKLITPKTLRDRLRLANVIRPEADPATMAELRLDLEPAVLSVESLIGRRVDAWAR